MRDLLNYASIVVYVKYNTKSLLISFRPFALEKRMDFVY